MQELGPYDEADLLRRLADEIAAERIHDVLLHPVVSGH
jgi:hypothetical protein